MVLDDWQSTFQYKVRVHNVIVLCNYSVNKKYVAFLQLCWVLIHDLTENAINLLFFFDNLFAK